MKFPYFFALVVSLLASVPAQAQSGSDSSLRRPRIVATSAAKPQAAPTVTPTPTATPLPATTPTPTPNPRVIIVNGVQSTPTPLPTAKPSPALTPTATPAGAPTATPQQVYPPVAAPVTPRGLVNYGQVRASITEAKRLFQTQPAQTASTDGFITTEIVTLAVFDPKTKAMHTVKLPKSTFLKVNYESFVMSSLGKQMRVRTVRANGVNTAVAAFDETGTALVPLVVQYPIERGGQFVEMAYYTSAHPAVLSPDTTRAGQLYIRTTFETALKKLRERGKVISPEVIAAAEDLCVIEHVDHQRFLNESRPALYDEIFTLFALNEGNTYRYAVSTAGAGGLVQMIPATYRMVRNFHPTINLNPDFVAGMRDHVNALQAMLLYMQDTWNDLRFNATVNQALENGWATEAELMAAGYNSNPARLPLYIRRGGAGWRTLIPRETQMYLQIQRSVQASITKLPPVKQ